MLQRKKPNLNSLIMGGVAGLMIGGAGAYLSNRTNAESLESAKSDSVTLGDPELTSGIPGIALLTQSQIEAWLADESNHLPLKITLPPGLDAGSANIYIPDDNPMTRAKIELGRQLYFDERLSSDNTVSCASCHDPAQGWGAEMPFGVGVRGQTGGRNSPVSFNRILSKAQFWDGRADSLEDQAVGPIANAIEMGNTHDASIKTIAAIPGYQIQFEKIFEDGVTIDNVGKALATFERAIVTGPMPYDAYDKLVKFETTFADDLEYLDEEPELKAKYDAIKADTDAMPMSESAQRGMKLFAGKANCAACHAGANFTDEQYHNLGVGMEAAEPDLGRFDQTGEDKDRGAFKTPTLRNIAFVAPYMHDGSQGTLEEVVEWYNKGGHKNPYLSDKMKPLNLTEQEQADLIAFMVEGLTGEFPYVSQARLPQSPAK
ncbi:cytochrome-c peroxidase [Rubripirellula reticaptiva]|uniref:Methylamine utilization protein MauG n=1 Tax=Rubripirellula reticaptiva TaxID=2528013 RepID=A0A5C6EHQ3_9BACT|nr:cytochrome c peroxidase [Rubripirellula reticaptiva]TWU47995.1 Cytochrome c551 peroxidase precursor [Rubripirellula reticaptiva]